MKFGICTSFKSAPAVRAAGFEYIEENAQGLFQALVPDGVFTGLAEAKSCGIPIPAANCLLPGSLRLTGPSIDTLALQQYLNTLLPRARDVGIQTLVFGSGAARLVPEGFPRDQAFTQIVAFLRLAAPLAAAHGVTIVVEPLNSGECNIINTVAEAMDYVRAANTPAIKCLVDSYHVWKEQESLDGLRAALQAGAIAHVHLADLAGRVAPGESGPDVAAAYREFFGALKRGKYTGNISVESSWPTDMALSAPRVREFLQTQWNAA
jgi:sugar phosphate isomerase/epimerase